MAFTPEQLEQVTALMDDFIKRNRPAVTDRKKFDIGWRQDRQNVYVYEVRRVGARSKELVHKDIARISWLQRAKEWHVYWLRRNGKWELYEPLDAVVNLQRFLIELERDPHGCFWGC